MTHGFSLIRAVAAPFLAVDRAIQRAVDAGAHAIMRRGVSKGSIRYVVTVAYAVSLVVEIASVVPYYARHPAGAVVNGLFAGWWAFLANRGAKLDEQAESREMLAAIDVSTRGDWLWRAFAVAEVISNDVTRSGEVAMAKVSPLSDAQLTVHYWAVVVEWALFGVMFYLRRTPRVPPTRRQESRVPAGLATEGAR